MMPMTLNQVAEYTGGKLVGGSPERCVSGVGMDSRAVKPGSLFIALRGKTQDGHQFCAEAQRAGAIAALVERVPSDSEAGAFGWILVPDSLKAFQCLAARYRHDLTGKVIGITGSSGKSSTKEMMASVLSQQFLTHKNRESFNNHTGLPLTLLEATLEHKCIIVEMGMNHPGELEALVDIAQPDMGVITNIGWAHIEAFEDQQALAQEKGSLIRKLSKKGVAILNADDSYVRAMAATTQARVVFAGSAADAAYRYDAVRFKDLATTFCLHTPQGKIDVTLRMPAVHMIKNAVLAAAVGGEMGLSLEQIAMGLSSFELPERRCAITATQNGGWLIDDSFNANPDSVLAGLETLKMLPGGGRQVVLLGMMGELGKYSESLHRMVGKAAAQGGVEVLLALGPDSKFLVDEACKAGLPPSACRWFENHAALAQAYQALALAGDKILIKGSKSQQMQKVTHYLTEGGLVCSTT